MSRFVVCGTGHSGTKFLAEAISACGLRCGHEAVYDHDTRTSGGSRRWYGLDGDASLAAIGYPLGRFAVAAVIRNPFDVVRSLYGEAFFADECADRCGHEPGEHLAAPYYQWMCRHVEGFDDLDELGRAVLWVTWAWERCEAEAGRVWRLEDLDGPGLADLVRWLGERCDLSVRRDLDTVAHETVTLLGTATNRHRQSTVPDAAMLDTPHGEMLAKLADRFDYQPRSAAVPTSNLAIAPAVLHLVHQVPHRRVLDVGIGHGKYGLLLREYLNDPIEHLAGVEGEPSYVERFPWVAAIYDELRVEDVMLTDPEWLATFDVVMFIDSLEHLTKEGALELIDRIPGRIVICTPAEFFDNPPGLSWTETHRSVFELADFGDRVETDVSQLGGIIVTLGPKDSA